MIKKIVFATNNQHKLKEIRKLMGDSIEILSLKDIGCVEELPETGRTLEENALQKAQYVYEKYGWNCFSDDSGLEVDALGGRPGVRSARFAGPHARSKDNIVKLLTELREVENRNAKFRTVIALIRNTNVYYFEGEIQGMIIKEEKGDGGFGYDSVFQPAGFEFTFAEMSDLEKNEISHRGIAVKALVKWLQENS
ncbi:MAG: non-canonical purine NTP diphosphatase [Bacteroidetes bacterium]|nr:MAG: non-canonical purine NTP diphosphatase [Bacteroidota bacterium]REK00056.1 MAG: non-canonical purine NTP diphosphatase [Bacteroidota bacterium]REK32934.1 MAG: non-canonical purine NTP diphosphatase [Bacteroidota bacterium]REK47741.1 MAG: non-canonical purine NTP diphosphatase [Bacteroidota bacterium]